MPVHLSPADASPAVIAFWFDAVGHDRWFIKDPALDADIARRFGPLRDAVLASEARGWRDTPEPLMAAILLLDQFSRNIHRGSALAFAADPLARDLAMQALENGSTDAAPVAWRQFLLMPLMHSEALADQARCVAEFERLGNDNLTGFARRHHDQIVTFGRFPGRNAALGRRTTDAEQAALDSGAAF